MQKGYMEDYQKKLVPGNFQKKRLDRTYQSASSMFDLFPPKDSALLKLLQSEKEEEMDMDSIIPTSHFLNPNFPYSNSQTPRKRNTNIDNSASKTPYRNQKNNSLSSFYLFLDDYSSSFMDTKISSILTREFSKPNYIYPKRQ